MTRRGGHESVFRKGLFEGRVAVVDAQNHVRWKAVTTGMRRENRVEITSGIRQGERIVTENPGALKEGELVRIGA